MDSLLALWWFHWRYLLLTLGLQAGRQLQLPSALIAKENLVSTFSVLYGLGDASEKSVTMWSGFAGMITDAGGILALIAMCAFVAFNM